MFVISIINTEKLHEHFGVYRFLNSKEYFRNHDDLMFRTALLMRVKISHFFKKF